jgi:hypothetical protein
MTKFNSTKLLQALIDTTTASESSKQLSLIDLEKRMDADNAQVINELSKQPKIKINLDEFEITHQREFKAALKNADAVLAALSVSNKDEPLLANPWAQPQASVLTFSIFQVAHGIQVSAPRSHFMESKQEYIPTHGQSISPFTTMKPR